MNAQIESTTPQSSAKPLWLTGIALFSLVAAVGAIYWSAVGFDFVNWDDPWYVQNNELIKSWSAENLAGIATETVTRNYAPLTIFSFLIDHTLWGDLPTGFHLTNVLLHMLNTALVFLLLRQLTGRSLVAWATALLFAVHPVQVETVAWISSRKGLLSASFMLGSLLFWFRQQRSGRDEAIGIGFLCCALLSKAIGVVIPPIVLMYDMLVRGKTFGESLVRQIVPGTFAFLLLARTMASQNSIIGGLRDHLGLSKMHLIAIDSTLLWRYVGMLILPKNLCVLYNPPTTGIAWSVVVSMIGLACVAFAAWSVRKRWPLVTLAIAVFYLLFVPVLNLFPITTLMNDRYLYLPSIAFFGVFAAGVGSVVRYMETALGRIASQSAGIVAVATIAVFFASATREYLPVWSSSTTLWSHAMEKQPEIMLVRIQHACALNDIGRSADGLVVLQTALKECPSDSPDRERMQDMMKDWFHQLAQRSINARAAVRVRD